MMTSRFQFLMSALAVAACVTLPAFGFDGARTRVTIPFAFEASNLSLPAGQYLIEKPGSGAALYVTGPDGRTQALLMSPTGEPVGGATGKLVFEKMGGTYRLAEVYLPGAQTAGKIPATKAQLLIARRAPVERIELAMALP